MITDLRLQNFRTYRDASFEFQSGVSIIVGPNASGKTNLLEAILVLARGGSYRAKDSDLIEFDLPWARLDAHLHDGSLRTIKLIKESKPGKQYEVAGKPYSRLGMNQRLPIVLFEPNHLQLLTGSPEGRRAYLDDILEQTRPDYGSLRRRYRRTLAQRNALLKQTSSSVTTQLFPWNLRLSELAGQIVRERQLLTESINAQLADLYEALAHKTTRVIIEYDHRWAPEIYETELLKKLESSLELDRIRGFTGVGPHREDLILQFNDHPASETASRGETRTLVLALKIIELQTLAREHQVPPLLLLDDVFSELDGTRRRALTEHLASYQTFITTTDADLVVQHFSAMTTIIPIG